MARVLLAEDDDSMRSFLAKALERQGHEVVACADGDEALTRLAAVPVDHFQLVLTDIVMPGTDGIEVARRVGESHPNMEIMFITGYAAVRLTAGKSAPQDCKVLSRPFHLRQLVKEVCDLFPAAAEGKG